MSSCSLLLGTMHYAAVNGTESMRLEREVVERERDIWAVALLPPGVGVTMWEGDFSPCGDTSDGGRGEVAGRGSGGDWSLWEGVEAGGGEGEDVGEVSRIVGRAGGVMLWVGEWWRCR